VAPNRRVLRKYECLHLYPVQLIKLVQAEAGMGNARVRPPRLELAGTELEKSLKIIREALRTRPRPVSGYTLSGRK
jgi:hypothetical protein